MLKRLLNGFVHAGARRISVITGYQAECVEAFVGSLSGLKGVHIDFVRETVPRGNIGALSLLPRDGCRVLLCFADLVTTMDFGRMAQIHLERQADVTLASHYEYYQVRLGELRTDGMRVLEYSEKPKHRVLICSGVAVFEPAVLDLIPGDGTIGISDLVQAALAAGHTVTHWLHESFWMDVNTQESLLIANRTLPRDSFRPEAIEPQGSLDDSRRM